MKDYYFTVVEKGESLYKEKGSKFLGFAINISDQHDFKTQLNEIKKQYHDARHFCFGYVLGYDLEYQQKNDDGEPGHSAGDPILGQIVAGNLTFTAVIVVRHFGGTKLGVGGLKQAYKKAALEALENAKISKKWICDRLTIYFGYNHSSEIMRIISDHEAKIIYQSYLEACEINIEVRKSFSPKIPAPLLR